MSLNVPIKDFYNRHVKNLKPAGNGQLKGLCPFHEDRNPSLSINAETGQWFCHACVIGGGPSQLAEQLGVDPPDNGKPDNPEATYDYHDENGQLLFQVVRLPGKKFRQRRPDGSGGWIWNLKGVSRVLYRLPDLKGKGTVYIVEGEKDADRLWSIGIPATTSSGGAGKWRDDYTDQIKAAGVERVWVLPDNDDEGRKHTNQVALSCLKAGLQVKVVKLPDLPEKGDVSSWLDKGHTKDELFEIGKTTPEMTREGLRDDSEGDERPQGKTTDGLKGRSGRELAFPEPEPWPEPLDGAELLEELTTVFCRYLVLPEGAAEVMALWVVHTHTVETAEITPRLALLSPDKRCGKTRVLEVLQKLVRCPLSTSNTSAAAVFRSIEAWFQTLIIDEGYTFLGDKDDLRGILNSGHSRAMGFVIRVEGEGRKEPRLFSTFAPVAIAQIGKLAPTLEDRSIIVSMHRKTRAERVEKLRIRRTADLDTLARKVARWAEDNLEALAEAVPETPDALHDRAADNWEHLLAIADLAGGPWPERARAVAVALSCGAEAEVSSLREQLLIDVQHLFAERNADRLPSKAICDALAELEDRRWPEYNRGKPISPNQLARLLKPFEVKPKTLRFEEGTKKGYELGDFAETFERYTPPQRSRNTVTSL